jgi:outer membrane protein TolC
MNIMKRSFIFLSIVLLLFACPRDAAVAETENPSEIEKLIEEAVNNNPRLKSFGEAVSVMRERPSQVTSLDNPRLKLSIMNLPTDTYDFDQEPMTQKQITLMQKFPFPGKLELKGKAAEQDVNISSNDYSVQRNILIKDVKTAYARVLFLDSALEITEQNRALLREFVRIVETKYEVGLGIQQDVLKAQLELSKMTDRIISFTHKREKAVAKLNTLLNRPVQTGFSTDNKVKMTDLTLSFEELKEIADAANPMLHRSKHRIEKNQNLLQLANRNYYPDFDIGLSYGQREDTPMLERADFVSAFVTVKLPLWLNKKEDRKVAETEAAVRKALADHNSIKNTIYFQIKNLMADIRSSSERIELFRSGLIPQSRLALESALSAYKVNKVDFLTLVSSQITLYNFELEQIRAISEHEIKLAELEAVIGSRISGS